jgi:hypothetical protein
MKIYQIHKYGGEYEDYYDYIVGSYLRKERADEELSKMVEKEFKLRCKGDKCYNCPFLEDGELDFGDLLLAYPDYCAEAKLLEDTVFGIVCKNEYTHWDNSYFEIKEVEVEE